jgi:hypothetical protein
VVSALLSGSPALVLGVRILACRSGVCCILSSFISSQQRFRPLRLGDASEGSGRFSIQCVMRSGIGGSMMPLYLSARACFVYPA